MTAIRSLIWRTTAMLCETKSIDSPSVSFRSSSRLMIVACTDTSSADTGSSAISTVGLEGERPGDPDALALTAGELARRWSTASGGSPTRSSSSRLALATWARGTIRW